MFEQSSIDTVLVSLDFFGDFNGTFAVETSDSFLLLPVFLLTSHSQAVFSNQ